MKRLHINLSVDDLAQSTAFYSALFDAEPTVRKPDYVKWMLEDPRINFAISSQSGDPGLNHLGIQAESEAELAEVQARLQEADGPVRDEGQVTRCYARTEKSWIRDPQGVAWEVFRTMGESDVYGPGATGGPEACHRTPKTETQPNPCCA